jgi:AhpD family alkylhydroperoxidase
MGKTYPEAYTAMDALDKLVAVAGIDPWHREMIRIRASYINGCAYCVDSHTGDASQLGVHPRKIALVPVWREAGTIFTEAEQVILLLTEEISLIHQKGISNEVYEKCVALFGERYLAELMMTAITINAWNRVGVGLNLEPKIG